MAKYTVTHACGHTQTHSLIGRNRDRESKLEWLAGTDCTDCWQAAKDKERKVASEAAAQMNASASLPALEGTPKQIAWAETIRSAALNKLAEFARLISESPSFDSERTRKRICEVESNMDKRLWLDYLRSLIWDTPLHEELSDLVALMESDYRQVVAAKFWIDNRDSFGSKRFSSEVHNRIPSACPTIASLLQQIEEGAVNG